MPKPEAPNTRRALTKQRGQVQHPLSFWRYFAPAVNTTAGQDVPPTAMAPMIVASIAYDLVGGTSNIH
jgi:hypothetical protein